MLLPDPVHWTSLNFSNTRPHSYPALTSFTSSLNRFRDASGPFKDLCSFTGNTDIAASLERTVQHIRTGDGSDTGSFEQLTYFCVSDDFFFEDRIQHALHSCFYICNRIVDDSVETSLTSTPSRSAVAFAVASGRTLNPMMIALDAHARLTSDSLMAPTPPWMILTTTSSLESFRRLCFTASTEPCTSALTMISFSSFGSYLPGSVKQVIQGHFALCLFSSRSLAFTYEGFCKKSLGFFVISHAIQRSHLHSEHR